AESGAASVSIESSGTATARPAVKPAFHGAVGSPDGDRSSADGHAGQPSTLRRSTPTSDPSPTLPCLANTSTRSGTIEPASHHVSSDIEPSAYSGSTRRAVRGVAPITASSRPASPIRHAGGG